MSQTTMGQQGCWEGKTVRGSEVVECESLVTEYCIMYSETLLLLSPMDHGNLAVFTGNGQGLS